MCVRDAAVPVIGLLLQADGEGGCISAAPRRTNAATEEKTHVLPLISNTCRRRILHKQVARCPFPSPWRAYSGRTPAAFSLMQAMHDHTESHPYVHTRARAHTHNRRRILQTPCWRSGENKWITLTFSLQVVTARWLLYYFTCVCVRVCVLACMCVNECVESAHTLQWLLFLIWSVHPHKVNH